MDRSTEGMKHAKSKHDHAEDLHSAPKARYRNSFYEHLKGFDPEFYETTAKPEEYRGHLIYNRIKAPVGRGCWDVVKNEVCIAQYAGPQGARNFIDRILDVKATEWDLDRAGAA